MSTPSAALPATPSFLRLVPGLAVLASFAVVAQWIAGGLGEPLSRNPVLVATLFGLLLGNVTGYPESLKPGLDFTKRYLLRFAVVLIGFRVTVRLLPEMGIGPVLIAVTELGLMLAIVYWVSARVFKLDKNLSLLLAGGSAICGAAAILSIGAMTRARTQQMGMAVTLITLFGSLALLVYPIAFLNNAMPGMDDEQFGVFVGASIYELAQVYGSSYAVSDMALNTATVTKLVKVVMLVPMLLALKYFRGADRTAPVPFPWFVIGFIAVVLANSVTTLHPAVRGFILDVDLFIFLMVMIAVGLDTRFARLREEGGALKLLGIGVVSLVLAASLTFVLVRGLGFSEAVAAAPKPARPDRPMMLASPGGRLFSAVGCAKCHVPGLATRSGGLAILYSDLLLHDMGPTLDDKITQGEATGSDWRTAPLSGLSLRNRYLHDGRATTLREAIMLHDGEAAIVRNRFQDLSEADQRLVYDFLRQL